MIRPPQPRGRRISSTLHSSGRCWPCRLAGREPCWSAIRVRLAGREPLHWHEFVALGLDPTTGEPTGFGPPRCEGHDDGSVGP